MGEGFSLLRMNRDLALLLIGVVIGATFVVTVQAGWKLIWKGGP